MIFATIAFAGIVAFVVFFGHWLRDRKPLDAAAAIMGLVLIGTSILALTG